MGKGKKGKALFSILGFAIGFAMPQAFGMAGHAFGGGLYGASLAGTLWSTFNKPKSPEFSDSSVQRFDKVMNTMTSTSIIPVIYGERKWGGNQTYHKPNPDLNMLQKHVVLCEGNIEAVVSVSANDLIVPTKAQEPGTVFTIQNINDEDAFVKVWNKPRGTYVVTVGNKRYEIGGSGKMMLLIANGEAKTITLASYKDAERSDLFDYNISISSLIAYINRLGNGWQAYPYSTPNTNRSPCDIYDIVDAKCYFKPAAARVNGARGNTIYKLYDCELPETYRETGSYKNTAWLDMNLTVSDELNGNPNVSCIIRGKKVLDTRTGKTAYSTNPAMCLLDFLLSRRYGMGKWLTMDNIDVESFNEAADYCDEMIEFIGYDGTVQKAKRYELNMIIDTKKSAMDWLGEILSNFCAFIVISQDKISLRIEKATPVSYKFDDNSIVQGSLTLSQMPLDDTPNKYEISFIDPLNNWNTAKAIVEDAADQKQRQKIITKSVELSGVTSQNQALRLGRFYRDLNTVCNINISFKTAMQGMHLEPGDVIEVTYRNIYKDMPFRIIEIKESNNGTFEINGRLYNESIYNDALGASIQIYDYTTMDTALVGIVPIVNNLRLAQDYFQSKDGMVVSEIIGAFDIPTYPFFDRCHIYYSINDGGWSYYGENLDGNFVIHNARTLVTYKVKVVLANTAGRQSEPVESEPIYVTGKDTPPSKPTGLTITEYDGGIILSWNVNPERDIAGYNVYRGDDLASFPESKLLTEKHQGTSLTLPITGAGEFAFYVQAVDNSGNVSVAEMIEYKTTLPPDVEGFDVLQNGHNLDFRWQAIAGHTYEIRRGTSWEYGETLGKPNNNFFQTIFPIPGDHKFWIKAINRYRNYSENATQAKIALLGDNTRNAIFKIGYSGDNWNDNFMNFHVTPDGLQLDDLFSWGEYQTEASLPKKYVARNWIDSLMIGITDKGTMWKTANFTWRSTDADTPWLPGGDISGAVITNQIAIRSDAIPSDILESIPLNGSTKGDIKGTKAQEEKHISYSKGRFKKGAYIGDVSKLSWKVAIPTVFHISFFVIMSEMMVGDVVYMTITGNGRWLYCGYDYANNVFYLQGSDGKRNEAKIDFRSNDYLSIGIGQGEKERKLFVSSFTAQSSGKSVEAFAPLGNFTDVFCYPKKGVVL